MSGTSPDEVFQTPDSVVIVEVREATHQELEPERPEPELDLGASPVLEGPVTRSGRKRKNAAQSNPPEKRRIRCFLGLRHRMLGPLTRLLPLSSPSLWSRVPRRDRPRSMNPSVPRQTLQASLISPPS